jgi:enoyl-CoA hydratase/carnithine racemase
LATLARDLELDTFTVEQDDRVLLVRFCDPPHNFMTTRMQKDLDILTAAVDADTGVGAVVLGPQRSHAAYRCKELIRGGAAPADPLPTQTRINEIARLFREPDRPETGSKDLSKTERSI